MEFENLSKDVEKLFQGKFFEKGKDITWNKANFSNHQSQMNVDKKRRSGRVGEFLLHTLYKCE